MQKNVDALLKVVERSHGTSGSKRESWGADDDRGEAEELFEANDVEVYLTFFEQTMTTFEVQERWVFKLFLQLTGMAQQAYAVMAVCFQLASRQVSVASFVTSSYVCY